jgi:hypothetical protein
MIPSFRGIIGTHPQGLAGLHPFLPLVRRDLLAADRRALSSPSALLWHLVPLLMLLSSAHCCHLPLVHPSLHGLPSINLH